MTTWKSTGDTTPAVATTDQSVADLYAGAPLPTCNTKAPSPIQELRELPKPDTCGLSEAAFDPIALLKSVRKSARPTPLALDGSWRVLLSQGDLDAFDKALSLLDAARSEPARPATGAVERVAEAIWNFQSAPALKRWDKLSEEAKADCGARQAAIAALSSPAREEAEGWRLVPVEPTEAMGNAAIGEDGYGMDRSPADVWGAMLAAAPPAAPAPSREVEALAAEMLRLAEGLGCGDDPFATWETLAALLPHHFDPLGARPLPDAWRTVPETMTDAMRFAWASMDGNPADAQWAAVLSVAPARPQPAAPSREEIARTVLHGLRTERYPTEIADAVLSLFSSQGGRA